MKKLLLFAFILMLFTGCSKQKKYDYTYFDVFDTYSTLTIYSNKPKDEVDKINNQLHLELQNLHKLFDIYNNYENMNNLKTVNDNAGIKPVIVDKKLLDLIEYGKNAYSLTDGNLNIAMGSVLKIWHTCRENANNGNLPSIPSFETLNLASKNTDINSIIIDKNLSTIYISNPNTSIDVGSIAKGYCADYGIEFLKEKGVDIALLNLGGNVKSLNNNLKETFTVGVISPNNSEQFVDKVKISNQSAVSSGNYQRFFEYNDEKYHHIIDPKTLYPANNNKSVTIVSNSSLTADTFSTTLFILPYEQGKELAKKHNLSVIWVDINNKVYKTENLQ